MQRFISVLFVLTIPLLLAAGNDDVRKELKALEGKWKAVAVEAGGEALPKEVVPDFTFVVAADGKSTGQMGKEAFGFTMTVDPKKTPKTIEYLHVSGADKGKKQYGVYKLEGDKFTVCLTPSGAAEGDQPKDLSTKDNTNVAFVFKRIKQDKKP